MIQLSSKNADSSLYDVIITHQNLQIDIFDDFSCDIDYNSCPDVFRMLSPL